MNDEQLERRLREAGLPDPSPEVRTRLLRAAGRKQASRRRGLILRWALSAAVVLLIAVNVAFDRHHSRAIEQITGRPAMSAATEARPNADLMLYRRQLLSQLIHEPDDS